MSDDRVHLDLWFTKKEFEVIYRKWHVAFEKHDLDLIEWFRQIILRETEE